MSSQVSPESFLLFAHSGADKTEPGQPESLVLLAPEDTPTRRRQLESYVELFPFFETLAQLLNTVEVGVEVTFTQEQRQFILQFLNEHPEFNENDDYILTETTISFWSEEVVLALFELSVYIEQQVAAFKVELAKPYIFLDRDVTATHLGSLYQLLKTQIAELEKVFDELEKFVEKLQRVTVGTAVVARKELIGFLVTWAKDHQLTTPADYKVVEGKRLFVNSEKMQHLLYNLAAFVHGWGYAQNSVEQQARVVKLEAAASRQITVTEKPIKTEPKPLQSHDYAKVREEWNAYKSLWLSGKTLALDVSTPLARWLLSVQSDEGMQGLLVVSREKNIVLVTFNGKKQQYATIISGVEAILPQLPDAVATPLKNPPVRRQETQSSQAERLAERLNDYSQEIEDFILDFAQGRIATMRLQPDSYVGLLVERFMADHYEDYYRFDNWTVIKEESSLGLRYSLHYGSGMGSIVDEQFLSLADFLYGLEIEYQHELADEPILVVKKQPHLEQMMPTRKLDTLDLEELTQHPEVLEILKRLYVSQDRLVVVEANSTIGRLLAERLVQLEEYGQIHVFLWRIFFQGSAGANIRIESDGSISDELLPSALATLADYLVAL